MQLCIEVAEFEQSQDCYNGTSHELDECNVQPK